jgi:hypothetical protein
MLRRALLLFSALVVVGAAACGGSSDSATKLDKVKGEGDGSAQSSDAGKIGDAATAADSGTGSGKGGSDAPSGDPGDVGDRLPSDFHFTGKGGTQFCSDMKALQDSYKTSTDPDPSFNDVAAKVAKIAPPPELASDWPTFVQVQQTLAAQAEGKSVSGVDGDTMAKFSAVSDKVSAYLTNVCKI